MIAYLAMDRDVGLVHAGYVGVSNRFCPAQLEGFLVSNLAIDLTEKESAPLRAAGLQFESMKVDNFDGNTLNTILLSVTSTATITALCNFLKDILLQRRSGKLKINGLEISDVSEATLLKLAGMNSSPGARSDGSGR